MSFPRWLHEQGRRTDIAASQQEENLRYAKPSKLGESDPKRWWLIQLASRWEWLPRLEWMKKKED